MQRGFFTVPHRLVEVIGILVFAPVKRYESFAVDSVGTASRPVVEHVVDPHAPEERVVLKVFGILLVKARLFLLGHPVCPRVGLHGVCLVSREPGASVADCRAEVGPVFPHLFLPYRQVVGRSAVPPDVLQPNDQVGDEVDGPVLVAAGDRRARGIHRAGRFVEFSQVGGHVVAAGREAGEDAPHNDRGVVDMLCDDLLELRDSVLLELRHGIIRHVAEEFRMVHRDVDPRQDPLFVAAVVEILPVGHDGRTHGIGPERADLRQVGVVVPGGQCSAREGVVVVERHAVDRHAHAVDHQASGGAHGDGSQSRPHGHPVGDAVFADRGGHAVHGRV